MGNLFLSEPWEPLRFELPISRSRTIVVLDLRTMGLFNPKALEGGGKSIIVWTGKLGDITSSAKRSSVKVGIYKGH